MNHHEPPFFWISQERDASEMQKEAVMAARLEAGIPQRIGGFTLWVWVNTYRYILVG